MYNSSTRTLSSGKKVTLLNQQIFSVKQLGLLIFMKMATVEQGIMVYSYLCECRCSSWTGVFWGVTS